MGAAFCRQPAFVRILEDLLSADDRFARDPNGAWRLATWQPAEGTLADQQFAVIDVEATGGRGEKHRAIEVGCVLVRAGQFAAQYESLIRPERPLANRTPALTGITAEMLDSASGGNRVLAELRDFIGESVLVAHNVAADLGVLNYESLWHGQPPIGNLALDTEELATRLL